MNNFVIDTPDNFWQIRWLDKYMEGHKGFIAGGCFKNILSGEKVKDIDIFFESESDFQEAVDLFNDEKHQKEGWGFKMWNYILEEGLEDWDEDDYRFYGLPLFKATAVKYGWDNPIGEDSGRERKYDSQY